MPIAQEDLALILKSLQISWKRTQPWQRRIWKKWSEVKKLEYKHIQTKANTDKLYETKKNQCYSPIIRKKKQCNLGVRFQAFPLLEFSSPLERCSDIYAGPTSC